MSDYGSIYLIDTAFNAERDATEVVFGYLEKETDVESRIMSLRIIVNVKGQDNVLEKGLEKAAGLMKNALNAPFEAD